jgi:hypothetical protein
MICQKVCDCVLKILLLICYTKRITKSSKCPEKKSAMKDVGHIRHLRIQLHVSMKTFILFVFDISHFYFSFKLCSTHFFIVGINTRMAYHGLTDIEFLQDKNQLLYKT